MAKRKSYTDEDRIRIMEQFQELRMGGMDAVVAAKKLGFKEPQRIYSIISTLRSRGLVSGTRGKAVATNQKSPKVEFTNLSPASTPKRKHSKRTHNNGSDVSDAMVEFLNSARKLWELGNHAS